MKRKFFLIIAVLSISLLAVINMDNFVYAADTYTLETAENLDSSEYPLSYEAPEPDDTDSAVRPLSASENPSNTQVTTASFRSAKEQRITDVIDRMKTYRGRIAKRSRLSTADKRLLIASIDDNLSKLEGYKASIASADSVAAIQTISNSCARNTSLRSRSCNAAFNCCARNNAALVRKLDGMRKVCAAQVKDLKSAGKDVSQLSNSLANMNTSVNRMKTALRTGRYTRVSSSSRTNYVTTRNSLRSLTSSLNQDLASVRSELVNFKKEMNRLRSTPSTPQG